MKKKTTTKLIASMAISTLMVSLSVSSTVLATHQATQTATTTSAATIEIVRVADGSTAVTSITFPTGTVSTDISNPANDAPETQILTATDTEATPVAQFKSASAYTLWYNVAAGTGWTDTVASEGIYVQTIDTALNLTGFDTNAFDMTAWGTDQEATPAQALAAGVNKELFLQVTLTANAGKTGTSTLTVLGETP